MLKKLTFKEYLDSKSQLKEAAKKQPMHQATYVVRKYCKLPVLINEQKQSVSLKPKHEISVKWLYEDINKPIIVSVSFNNDGAEHKTAWSDERIYVWLSKNTKVKNDV